MIKQKVEKLMKEANIMQTSVFKDYSNQPRFVIGTITKSTTNINDKKIILLEEIDPNP